MKVFSQEINESFKGIGPERPERLANIEREISLEKVPLKEEEALGAILKVHDESYVEKSRELCKEGAVLPDLNYDSFWGAALNAVNACLKAGNERGFAVVRPPGHHAYRDRASGFCFFNNAAIVIESLFQSKRVAIIDIDAHYGDGTHSIFKDSDRVFYASVHANSREHFPGVKHESENSILIDVRPSLENDISFIRHVKKLVEKAKVFEPEVLCVSAGFDTYYKDPIMPFSIMSHNTYKEVGKALANVCEERFALLEGGYHDELGKAVKAFVEGFS